jgi:hypothetical protein
MKFRCFNLNAYDEGRKNGEYSSRLGLFYCCLCCLRLIVSPRESCVQAVPSLKCLLPTERLMLVPSRTPALWISMNVRRWQSCFVIGLSLLCSTSWAASPHLGQASPTDSSGSTTTTVTGALNLHHLFTRPEHLCCRALSASLWSSLVPLLCSLKKTRRCFIHWSTWLDLTRC